MQIQRLILYSDRLDSLKRFYTHVLGLRLTHDADGSFGVQVGWTELVFQAQKAPAQYHFAFNIPSFMITEAQQWLAERLEILPYQGTEIVDFPNWNAEALYFLDPAENIVELIARKNLEIPSLNAFSSDAMLCVSEAGLPVRDADAVREGLMEIDGLKNYWGSTSNFRAIGDEEGLFILVPYQWKWMPNDTPVLLSPMQVDFSAAGQLHELHSEQGKVELRRPLIL